MRILTISLTILLFITVSLFAIQDDSVDKAIVGGRLTPDGAEINIDLPNSQHLRNKGGIDRAGLCVFTSMEHSGKWQNIELLDGLRDYMTKFPGGGWPERVDEIIHKIAKEKGMPVPDYIQAQGNREMLPLLKKAVDSGRMPCVTYGYSPTGRYNGRDISHMVSMVHYDSKGNIAILDNNYIGWDNYEWMDEETFYRVFVRTTGRGWAIVFLNSGPPNYPYSK